MSFSEDMQADKSSGAPTSAQAMSAALAGPFTRSARLEIMQDIAPSADFHRRRAAIAQNRPTQQRYRQAIAHFCGKPKS
jgi:hypothetical protein